MEKYKLPFLDLSKVEHHMNEQQTGFFFLFWALEFWNQNDNIILITLKTFVYSCVDYINKVMVIFL